MQIAKEYLVSVRAIWASSYTENGWHRPEGVFETMDAVVDELCGALNFDALRVEVIHRDVETGAFECLEDVTEEAVSHMRDKWIDDIIDGAWVPDYAEARFAREAANTEQFNDLREHGYAAA